MTEERYERGWEILQAIHAGVGEQAMERLEKISPDLARYIVEFPYGDVWSRPGLDLKSRAIATIASLTTLGHATSELKAHINAALNIGCSQQEIIEIMIHMAVYAGFPAAMNGIFAAHEVFAIRARREGEDGGERGNDC
jgi:4-carboxymuconolactone decarboxylase